jgi:hypothetical protein
MGSSYAISCSAKYNFAANTATGLKCLRFSSILSSTNFADWSLCLMSSVIFFDSLRELTRVSSSRISAPEFLSYSSICSSTSLLFSWNSMFYLSNLSFSSSSLTLSLLHTTDNSYCSRPSLVTEKFRRVILEWTSGEKWGLD